MLPELRDLTFSAFAEAVGQRVVAFPYVDGQPLAGIEVGADLGAVLRQLHRREARRRGGAPLTYREIAARAGWSHGIVGEYLAGRVLPPTDRFDILVRLFGASAAELGTLATARDRVEERLRERKHRPPVPRQLPADVAGFTGRRKELARLSELDSERQVRIVVICGPGGAGKTALALHWAHRVAEMFPDGQLYVDLQGYGPQEPMPAGQALALLLRGLGRSTFEPAEPADLAGQLRSLVAGRRLLLVLDNARDADQVRPLLPGTGPSTVLVTSRNELAGLVARDGAQRICLDVLPPADAVALLCRLGGASLASDPAGALRLADECGRLPLALRVIAELAARTGGSPRQLVGELSREGRRLDLLAAGGDPATAVAAVISWSQRRLGPAAARALARASVHPGPEWSGTTFAALAGLDAGQARAVLAELNAAHLVHRLGPDRYGMHDLVREFGATRCGPDEAAAARAGLLEHYLAQASESTPGWLEAERANLVAAAELAAEAAPAYAVRLSRALWRGLEAGGHFLAARAIHSSAERALAAEDGDPARADVLISLAVAQLRLGHPHEALPRLLRALALAPPAGEVRARAHEAAGAGYASLGRYDDAMAQFRRGLAEYRRLADRRGEGSALGDLGLLHDRLGHYQAAIACQRRAARLLRQAGDRRLEGYALGHLGAAYAATGQLARARPQLELALRCCEEADDRPGAAFVSAELGAVLAATGERAAAMSLLGQALLVAGQIGSRSLQADIRLTLGRTWAAVGRVQPALAHFRGAAALARLIADRRREAVALIELAGVLRRAGHGRAARPHRDRARRLYRSLGLVPARTP